MAPQIDTLIVGAGLAGCTLAWLLRKAGERVVIADRRQVRTSSQVAAGLIAPLSGPRLLPSWRFSRAWDSAMSFYSDMESRFGVRLFHPRKKLHLFATESERDFFQNERRVEYPQFVADPKPTIDPSRLDAPWGGFEMDHSGWLDVPAYLDSVSHDFINQGDFLATSVDPISDLRWNEHGIDLPRLEITVRRVVWCQGLEACSNPLFPGIRFNPAKGEVLTLRVPDLDDDRILFRGVWLVRIERDVYRCGATYDWENLDNKSTTAGAEELINRLRVFLKVPFTIIDHTAAVRPVIEDVRPMFGIHPHCRSLGFFNGLGSKGALLAPMLSREFTNQLIAGQTNDDPETSLTRKAGIQLPPRLTEMAQAILDPIIGAKDVVIDATAGNGFDTAFLARKVRNRGLVFAIDKQACAIESMQLKLKTNPSRQVKPILGDHAELERLIPQEHHGKIAAVMFNLGYLPRGDKFFKTTAETTRPALNQAVRMLRPGGVMTVMAYVGHPGGPEEARAVIETLNSLGDQIEWDERLGEPWAKNPPRLFVVRKK